MNLLIDLRIPGTDLHTRWYARAWIQSYHRHHPETHIILFGDSELLASIGSDSHLLPLSTHPTQMSWWSRIRYTQIFRTHSIDVCLSFSDLTIPLPRHTPLIRHTLGISRYYGLEGVAHHPSQTEYYLVHHDEQRKELIDRYEISESHIKKVDRWYPPTEGDDASRNISETKPYFIHDAGWGDETKIDRLLKYYQQHPSTPDLILIGTISPEYTRYRDLIRSYQLLDRVRIVTPTDESSLSELYGSASGWIYTGYHWTEQSSLYRALTNGLPLILSDIPTFSDLSGTRIMTKQSEISESLNPISSPHTHKDGIKIWDDCHHFFEKTGKKKKHS